MTADYNMLLAAQPTVNDVANATRAQNLQLAQGNQALQTGGIDEATKANAYATQIISAGAAGGQKSYDAARQHLQGMGIDVSGYAPDVATGASQAAAARQALISPLGMMNAQIQAAGVGAKIADVNGTQAAPIGATALPSPTPALGTPNLNTVIPRAASVSGTPAPGALPADDTGVTVQDPSTAPQAPSPNLPPPLPVRPTLNTIIPQSGAIPNGNALPPSNNVVQPAVLQPATGFVPSQGPQNENPEAKAKRIASELAVYNANPANAAAMEQAKAQASTLGKDQGAQPEKTAASQELFGRISQNLDAMLQENPNVPSQGVLLSAADKAAISQRAGSATAHPVLNFLGIGDNQAAANSYNAFTKVNKAQILNGIQDLVQSGSIRNSRALIQLVGDVNAIDENASPESRAQQIMAVKAELQNLMTSTENINADLNGGEKQPYAPIPMTAPATAPAAPSGNGWSYGGQVK